MDGGVLLEDRFIEQTSKDFLGGVACYKREGQVLGREDCVLV